jgi:hypothetical protein
MAGSHSEKQERHPQGWHFGVAKKSPSGEQGRVARRKGSRFTRPFSGLYLAKHSPRVKVLDAKKSLSEFDRLPLESVLSIIGTLDRQLGTDPWASIRYLSKGA